MLGNSRRMSENLAGKPRKIKLMIKSVFTGVKSTFKLANIFGFL